LRDEVFDAGERVFSGQDEPLADSVEDFLHVGRKGLLSLQAGDGGVGRVDVGCGALWLSRVQSECQVFCGHLIAYGNWGSRQ
jgi:hypothetical protein